jgi:hypothetical protein
MIVILLAKGVSMLTDLDLEKIANLFNGCFEAIDKQFDKHENEMHYCFTKVDEQFIKVDQQFADIREQLTRFHTMESEDMHVTYKDITNLKKRVTRIEKTH